MIEERAVAELVPLAFREERLGHGHAAVLVDGPDDGELVGGPGREHADRPVLAQDHRRAGARRCRPA